MRALMVISLGVRYVIGPFLLFIYWFGYYYEWREAIIKQIANSGQFYVIQQRNKLKGFLLKKKENFYFVANYSNQWLINILQEWD